MKKLVIALSALGLMNVALANGLMQPPCTTPDLSGFLIGIEGGYGYLGTPETNLYNQPNFYNQDVSDVQNQIIETHTVSNVYLEDHKIGDFSWGAHIGYDFQFRPEILLGIEAGYKNFGKSTYDSVENFSNVISAPGENPLFAYLNNNWHVQVKQQAIDLLLTGHFYVWKGLNVFGKAGAAYVNSKTEQTYLSSYASNVFGANQQSNILSFDSSYNFSNSIWRLRPEIALGVGYTIADQFDIYAMYDFIYSHDQDHAPYNSINPFLPDTGGAIPSSAITAPSFRPAGIYSVNAIMGGISFKFKM